MTGVRSRLFAIRTSPRWCRLAVVAPFVVLGAIALGACGSDTADTADEAGPAEEADNAQTTDETTDDAEQGSETDADVDVDADVDADVELFPDVVDATATIDADGTWTFAATLSSPYDSPERYADAWRVVGPDGAVYGIRELAHDHAGEQPFTRDQSGIEIPDSVTTVTIEGRDQVSGWGGATVAVELVR